VIVLYCSPGDYLLNGGIIVSFSNLSGNCFFCLSRVRRTSIVCCLLASTVNVVISIVMLSAFSIFNLNLSICVIVCFTHSQNSIGEGSSV